MVHVLLTLFVYMCTCMHMCIDPKYGTCRPTINVICIYVYVYAHVIDPKYGIFFKVSNQYILLLMISLPMPVLVC